MRMGISWPTGRGRRMWVSMGPWGWLLVGWVVLPVWAAIWVLIGLAWLVVQAARGAHRLAILISRP